MSLARFKITYKPPGVEKPREWEVDFPNGLKASEMIALKKASKGSIPGVLPLADGLAALDLEAVKGLLWLLLKRDMSTLPWDSLDFDLSEVEVEPVQLITNGRLRAKLEDAQRTGPLPEDAARRLEQLIEAGVEAEHEEPGPKE